MSVLAIETCEVGGAEHEVMSSLMLPNMRSSSFDSSTYDDWSEENILQNAPQLKLILDEMHYPSSPYSSHEVNIAKYIDFPRFSAEAPHRCSSFSTSTSVWNTTNGYASRARSLTPKRSKKVYLSSTKKPNSCRLPGAPTIPNQVFSRYPTTPSTTTTINIGTPVWYTWKDQLDSTRRRDEGNGQDFLHCQQSETPDSSLLSPMSGLKVASLQNSRSVSTESTPTNSRYGFRRRRRKWVSERKFRFTETSDLPRWHTKEEGVSVVPETAALNTEGGYFIGSWQLPITNTRVTIQKTGEVVSTDPKFSLSAKFLGSRTIQFKFPDGRIEQATLSKDGTQIEFMNGVTWTQVPAEIYPPREHLNLPREEDGLDRARASNICSIRSNIRDNDEEGLVELPAGIDFRPNIEIEESALHVDPLGLKGRGEELSLHGWCE